MTTEPERVSIVVDVGVVVAEAEAQKEGKYLLSLSSLR